MFRFNPKDGKDSKKIATFTGLHLYRFSHKRQTIRSCARHEPGSVKMKKLFLMMIAVVCIGLSANAQLNGQFITGQVGHVYFRAFNTTGYAFPVSITATSSDRSNSETVTVGQGFVLGPTTPWKWYWKSGDRITVTYPNGQSVYWQCPANDCAYGSNSPSFRGTNSDGYIYKGTITLTRITSGTTETFYHFNKGGVDYVATSKRGPYYRLARRMTINYINYKY